MKELDVYTLTREERQFLINLLGQANIRPSQPDAAQVVMIVQSILSKLNGDERHG